MLTDEDIDYAEQNYDRLDARKTKALIDEIARLRAEVARLEAGRLGPETVNFIRHEMFLQWNHPEDADEERDAVIADLDRCYPPEEV